MSEHRRQWEKAGGKVPDTWEFQTIEQLLESSKSISVGVMYPGSNVEGGIPLIKVSDVKNGAVTGRPEFCIADDVDYEYRRTKLNGSELLITLVGNPGDCVVVSEEMAGWNVARALAVVRLADIELRPWLRYVLLSKPAKHLIEARLNTTVQKTLNLKDIRELGLPIPPKEDREVITTIVGAIEKKTVLNSQINQTLEEMAQAIFKSWFVDFEPVKAKMMIREKGGREQAQSFAAQACIAGNLTLEELESMEAGYSGWEAMLHPLVVKNFEPAGLDQWEPEQLAATAALFPASLTDSPLGPIPEGWGVQRVENLLELAYGKALKKTDRVDGDIPVYGSGGLTGHHNQSLVNGPGIIVGRKGTVGSIYWEQSDFYPIDTVFYTAPAAGISLEFLYYLLHTLGLESMNTDAAVPGLNRNNVYRLEVPNYPEELIDVFAKVVLPLKQKVILGLDESATLAAIRDALLPKLLSGEISVGATEAELEAA
ncbi:MAG: restriction endonuclease subunit S [Zetaproteobacteria bacterium]|nr:restriction endonuclease subunit S [Zetaproteobacteria bacterium]